MDNDDSLDESQGSTKSVKGKRGVIWGNAETSALIKVWGEAEVEYALSSLKRNYEIFEMISTELGKIGFFRSAEDCSTKTKSLRKLYKLAVLYNNRSGSGRSKFIWYDEMAQIFRTDASIHPLRTTESESVAETDVFEPIPWATVKKVSLLMIASAQEDNRQLFSLNEIIVIEYLL
ncbi:hypothetical protein JRQ81_017621 [Phrynocephalus forsythii]|uniref:Myb/SANT-like DNA-binding domain-containing protein n=1 Tax=Phrynocephalus forsythii TaxID=171643 RepID=A0A9Q0XQR0_9SAUR|nr:hypothetical protein JRQ81_017621 [Phrynocephalus forsythii]